MGDEAPHEIVPIPKGRRLITDLGRIVKDRPVIRGTVVLTSVGMFGSGAGWGLETASAVLFEMHVWPWIKGFGS